MTIILKVDLLTNSQHMHFVKKKNAPRHDALSCETLSPKIMKFSFPDESNTTYFG